MPMTKLLSYILCSAYVQTHAAPGCVLVRFPHAERRLATRSLMPHGQCEHWDHSRLRGRSRICREWRFALVRHLAAGGAQGRLLCDF